MSNDKAAGHDPLAWLLEGEAAAAGADAAPTADDTGGRVADAAPAPVATDDAILLDDPLTVECAAALRERLLAAASGHRRLRLDGRAVERVDVAGLQVLAALDKSLRARGGSLEWAGVSPALSETAELAGLREAISLA